jgi:TPR repeat protein
MFPHFAIADLQKAMAAYDRGHYATALMEFQVQAESGSAVSQYYLGWMYNVGQGVPVDEAEALYWTRKAADQGYEDAQYNLGFMYMGTFGIMTNPNLSEEDRNLAISMIAYGQFPTYAGLGNPPEVERAVAWFRKAASRGHIGAQHELGNMLEFGFLPDLQKDEVEAARWFQLAAEQGHPESQVRLAGMYSSGRGVPKSDAEAFKWSKLAAEQGVADAMTAVAKMYATGQGTPKDDRKAAEWYRALAERGDAPAQFELARRLAHGEGVAQDYVRAHAWLEIAVTGPHGVWPVDIMNLRELLSEHLTAAQREEADKLSRKMEWELAR